MTRHICFTLSGGHLAEYTKRGKGMYIVGVIVYVAILMCTTLFSGVPGAFVDFPSLIILLAPSAALVLASGLMPDLMRGFRVMTQKENTCSMLELQKTDIAIGLAVKLLLLCGVLGTLLGMISMLATLSDVSALGRNVSVSLLTLLYAVLFTFILLPVRARVQAIIKTLD